MPAREVYEDLGFTVEDVDPGHGEIYGWDGPALRLTWAGANGMHLLAWWDRDARFGAQYLAVDVSGDGPLALATGCSSSAGDLALRLAYRYGLIVRVA